MLREIVALVFVVFFLASSVGAGVQIQKGTKAEEKSKHMTIRKMTANLYVEDVEPCVKFWVERLGFTKIAEVPDGDKLAFAILQKGDLELMYGSYASLDVEPKLVGSYKKGTSFLFLEVEDLDAIIEAMKGIELVLPPHTTFYGTKEISVKDPAGHMVTFAQMIGQPKP